MRLELRQLKLKVILLILWNILMEKKFTFIMKKMQMSILQLTQQLEKSKEQQLKQEVVSSH